LDELRLRELLFRLLDDPLPSELLAFLRDDLLSELLLPPSFVLDVRSLTPSSDAPTENVFN
jgi:hypothetical protein